jgi:AraC-like DNA-binding protein
MDPLADAVTLLRPHTAGTKVLHGAGRWNLHRSKTEYTGFGLILKGSCWLVTQGQAPLHLAAGDFVLIPVGSDLTIASDLECETTSLDPADDRDCRDREVWYGDAGVAADFTQLGGYFQLDYANSALLDGLLPNLVHIPGSDLVAGRLKRTIELIVEEALAERPGRDLIVDRLIEVLLVEALRYCNEYGSAIQQPGLVAGLADPLLARALRRMHDDVAREWSVETLAREAGLSRSAFSQRFGQKVGIPPMRYLMDWRMALAKSMLQGEAHPLEGIASVIGYQSASAFSTAFRREVGESPSHFARKIEEAPRLTII